MSRFSNPATHRETSSRFHGSIQYGAWKKQKLLNDALKFRGISQAPVHRLLLRCIYIVVFIIPVLNRLWVMVAVNLSSDDLELPSRNSACTFNLSSLLKQISQEKEFLFGKNIIFPMRSDVSIGAAVSRVFWGIK